MQIPEEEKKLIPHNWYDTIVSLLQDMSLNMTVSLRVLCHRDSNVFVVCVRFMIDTVEVLHT